MKKIIVLIVIIVFWSGETRLSAQDMENRLKQIPVTEYYAKGKPDYFVILYTGDGGWRQLDVQLAKFFNSKYIPLVGIDSRSYFWSRKSKKQIGNDLRLIMNKYRAKWKKDKVVLIGYSFGADISPFAYVNIPEKRRKEIKKIILVAPSEHAQFEIKLISYLYTPTDGAPVKKEIDQIDSKKLYVICDDNENALCNQLNNHVEHTFLGGGHHFNSNYKKLQALVWGALSKKK